MTRQVTTVCEGCGEVAQEEKPRNWFTGKLTINGQKGETEIDVCSYECLSRYADKQAKRIRSDSNG